MNGEEGAFTCARAGNVAVIVPSPRSDALRALAVVAIGRYGVRIARQLGAGMNREEVGIHPRPRG